MSLGSDGGCGVEVPPPPFGLGGQLGIGCEKASLHPSTSAARLNPDTNPPPSAIVLIASKIALIFPAPNNLEAHPDKVLAIDKLFANALACSSAFWATSFFPHIASPAADTTLLRASAAQLATPVTASAGVPGAITPNKVFAIPVASAAKLNTHSTLLRTQQYLSFRLGSLNRALTCIAPFEPCSEEKVRQSSGTVKYAHTSSFAERVSCIVFVSDGAIFVKK